MSTKQVVPFFAVPISTFVFPGSHGLNEALKEKLLEYEQQDLVQGKSRPGVERYNLYESDFSLFRRNDQLIQRVAGMCLNAVGDLVKHLNHYDVEDMQRLRIYEHSWFHITRPGGYFRPHNHPMASWSGVYCVTPGSNPAGIPSSGILQFLEPRTTAGMYLDPGNVHLERPFGFGDQSFALEAGQLVLFPSYLHHEVTPFQGVDERITIAFNCWLRYADQAVDEPSIRIKKQ